jgi:DNA-binding response OmpR family regulator
MEQHLAASPGNPRQTPGQSLHVLVVDDEPQLLRLMEIELGAAGFDVTVAADGNEALASMQARMPDVVLLDLMMPYRDGWSVLEEIRQWRTRPRVIVASAIGLHSQRQRAVDMGAAGYLVKPFSIDKMLDLVRSALGSEPTRGPGPSDSPTG